ncbi:hypothetical protein TWF703_000069 [Orbilia oligospora]|uniref:Uncharacterized protein n=1 Tax=Orbilia oligospora TaxID=2813651 RepID=A0A7C8JU32_ORBOL|nr:hypothetical protein TWF703_000069 [Orbilia oligospora]
MTTYAPPLSGFLTRKECETCHRYFLSENLSLPETTSLHLLCLETFLWRFGASTLWLSEIYQNSPENVPQITADFQKRYRILTRTPDQELDAHDREKLNQLALYLEKLLNNDSTKDKIKTGAHEHAFRSWESEWTKAILKGGSYKCCAEDCDHETTSTQDFMTHAYDHYNFKPMVGELCRLCGKWQKTRSDQHYHLFEYHCAVFYGENDQLILYVPSSDYHLELVSQAKGNMPELFLSGNSETSDG